MAKSKPKANITNIKKSAGKAVSKTYTKANYKKAVAGSQQAQTAVDKPVETTSADAATKPRKPRTVVRCYVDVLDQILTKIKPVDWHQLKSVLENIEDRQAFHTIERILKTVDADNAPIVNHVSAIHCYNGKHYVMIDETKLMCFLIEAARQCGVPKDRAMYQTFVRKITKQILINPAWRYGGISAPDTPFINLQNGTLFFDKEGHRFEAHSPQHFIRYCLGFNYDPDAKAPLWQEHLDRSLPNPDVQAYLAACLALPFYPGKIEKAPILYGRRDTGKSTTLDVYKALIGSANCTSATLKALTRISPTGDYHRSLLDGKLVNIASKFGDEGLAKMLISREPINVREMREQPFGKDGNQLRVGNGSTIKQIELKNYLLSLPDKTLLNGKKDIIKVLRGYIDRGQLHWTINERTSKLKDGTEKKQAIGITIRSFPPSEQSGEQSKSRAVLPFQAPETQQQQSAPMIRQPSSSYVSPDGKYEMRTSPDGRQVRINYYNGGKKGLGCWD